MNTRKLMLFSALALCGCAPKFRSGTVVQREHFDAYASTCYVKAGNMLYPITTPHPERWEVTLGRGNETETFSVDRATYDRARIGSPLDLSRE